MSINAIESDTDNCQYHHEKEAEKNGAIYSEDICMVFQICQECFWCASNFDQNRIFNSCPYCGADRINSLGMSADTVALVYWSRNRLSIAVPFDIIIIMWVGRKVIFWQQPKYVNWIVTTSFTTSKSDQQGSKNLGHWVAWLVFDCTLCVTQIMTVIMPVLRTLWERDRKRFSTTITG